MRGEEPFAHYCPEAQMAPLFRYVPLGRRTGRPSLVYRNYLRTCEMLGIEPTPREHALGLVQEWTEVLSGRPEPTQH